MSLLSRLLLFPVLAAPLFGAPTAGDPPPRLGVFIVVDQFRADYLDRFDPYFSEGGFRRLMREGYRFENCHYRYAVTKTAVGHATVATGALPEVHGIIANEWIDRDSWQFVTSVEDSEYPLIGAAPVTSSPGGYFKAKSGRSPRRLLEMTVGDQLKLRFGARSRVISLANKDRSAILLGGAYADGAYWLDGGRFVTSQYYRDELPAWVEAFNAEQRVERAFGAQWTHLLDRSVYDAVQGPDDAEGESDQFGLTRVLPKTLNGGGTEVTPAYYEAFSHSPLSLELVAAFAELALREEQLGLDDTTDLLCIGFSQTDLIGHAYGPDSHEVMDSVLRLDRLLEKLLLALDQQVGVGRYVLTLTADHGVSPLPERVQQLGSSIPSGRYRGRALEEVAQRALDAAFGPLPDGLYWVSRDNFGFHFQAAALEAKQLRAEDAAPVLRDALREQPGVAAAYTRAEVLAAPVEGNSLLTRTRRSYHADRSAAVVFIIQPYHVDRHPTGTNHGTPYEYDTHVPQVWFGAGVPAGSSRERVGVDDIAVTMAYLLRVPPSPRAVGRPLL